jgi:hypothetical protein
MRLARIGFLIALCACLAACGGRTASGSRPDTGETITIIVENQEVRRATVSFSWQRDQLTPLGTVQPGDEDTFETVWQDLPFRLAVERSGGADAFTQEFRPEPDDTIRLTILEGYRMVARIGN